MPELFSATLNISSPRYGEWLDVFGTTTIPLLSPTALTATLGEEKNVQVYLLNLRGMSLKQRAVLLSRLATKFQVPIYEVEERLNQEGCPIRAEDVIVSISTRAFV